MSETMIPPADESSVPLHERRTTPPSASDFPSPELVTMADRHTQRLTAIEASLERIADAIARIDSNITTLMVDARSRRHTAESLKRDVDILRSRVLQFAEEEQ